MADRHVRVRVSVEDGYTSPLNDYNRKLRQSGDATSRASRETRSFTSSLGGLQGAAVGAVAALGVSQVIQFGVQMQQVGQQVNIVGQSFDQLAAEVGGAEVVLSAMRDATGGVINDLDLMTAANSLLLTGVASSADQLAFMTSGAVKLGAAMGQDATASIENFNSAMLNMSYERLDTLGVSAAAVRERVKQLKQEGLDTGEAFSQATLEQMEVSLARLGPAAEASATQVEQLKTDFENLYQTLSSRFAMGVEGSAGFIKLGIDIVVEAFEPHESTVIRQQIRDRAQEDAEAYYDAFLTEFDNPQYDAMVTTAMRNSDIVKLAMMSQLEAIEQGLELPMDEILYRAGLNPNDISSETMRVLETAANFVYLYDPEIQLSTSSGLDLGRRGRERGLLDDTMAMNQQAAAAERERLRIQQDYEASVDRQASNYLSFLDNQREAGEYQRTFSEYANSSEEAWQRITGLAASSVNDFRGIPIATQAAANEAERLRLQAEGALQAAIDLGVEGDELTQFQSAADDAARLADEVGRAADNLSTMGSRGMFGGRNDPTQAFFNDILSASGVGDETRMIATGEMSVVEQRFNEQIAPLLQGITAEFGEEAAVGASKRFVDEYTRSIEQGLSENEALARATERIGFQMGEGGVQYAGPRGYDALGVLDQFGGSMLGFAPGMGLSDFPAMWQRGMAGDLQGEMGTGSAEQLTTEQEINATLEERSGIVSDVNARLEEGVEPMSMVAGLAKDLSNAEPPDFSASALGLDSADEGLQVITDKLAAITETEHTVRVIYEIETRGSLPPGGGEFVPVTTGQQ